MTETLLVAGTASHVGKSTVVAGLCRRFSNVGVSVAPYKAQNMSNNARAVLTPDGNWGEIGVSQYVQARAARVAPTTDLNPVLLKPRGDGESQLVVDGQPVGHYEADTYYEEHWEQARNAAVDAHDRLADHHDLIVAEGAGSIAEINLHDRDLANLETARFADASILLVGDIERGGVFASLYGTVELLPEDIRERLCGIVITKFRGDRSLLAPGIEELEYRTGVPVVGVLPYDDPSLPAEDSLSLPAADERGAHRGGSGESDALITIGVPRLPHISNFTDLDPLARCQAVRVVYLPLDSTLTGVDAVVIPGTKNTVDDLVAIREAGFDEELISFSGPIVGVCGGYQLLGERITNAGIESTDREGVIEGVGLLPVETRFEEEKRVRQTTVDVLGTEPLTSATGSASGYEIHMGQSEPTEAVSQPLDKQSAARGSVLGTYLHGLFENETVRDAFLETVFRAADSQRPDDPAMSTSPYENAATLLDELDETWLDDICTVPAETGVSEGR